MGGREMIRKRFTPEQVIGKLREADGALASKGRRWFKLVSFQNFKVRIATEKIACQI
jgi:hypothetical protein